MPSAPTNQEQLAAEAAPFYRHALSVLKDSNVPFLIGGGYALETYSDIKRYTKDLDIFVLPEDAQRTLQSIAAAGYRTELTFSHWLGKAFFNDHLIDVIFNSGNGLCRVDQTWFDHALERVVLDEILPLCPPEEIIWQKSFIMERDRFDGSDINHILRKCGPTLDWRRLLDRFGPHGRVLLSHLILFGFVYPAERDRVPEWVLRELLGRFEQEQQAPAENSHVCRGTLLSNMGYRPDVEEWGYQDPRLTPLGTMTPEQTAYWTAAFERP